MHTHTHTHTHTHIYIRLTKGLTNPATMCNFDRHLHCLGESHSHKTSCSKQPNPLIEKYKSKYTITNPDCTHSIQEPIADNLQKIFRAGQELCDLKVSRELFNHILIRNSP